MILPSRVRSRILLGGVLVLVAVLVAVRLREPDAPGSNQAGPVVGAEWGAAAPDADAAASTLRARESTPESEAPSEADVVEHRLPLDGRLEVDVVSKKTGAPIAGIEVRASLNFHTANAKGGHLEIWRTATTGADGLAVFAEFPRSTTVTLLVQTEGYRSATVDASLERREPSKRIRLELHPALSAERSSVRLALPPGAASPGIAVRYLDRTNGGAGHASPEAPLVIDDDPDGRDEHDVELQLVLPGYAGARWRERLRRGTTLVLSPPRAERVAQEIALLDEEGRGVEALAVSVWPTAASGSSVRVTELSGVTDARGLVSLEGYRGTEWRLEADATRVHLVDPSDRRPFVVGGARPTFRVGRRMPHRLRLDGPGLPARGRAELVWRSYEPVPGSALEARFRDEPARFTERIRRYVESLPRSIEWTRLASGALVADLPLLPGGYMLTASTDQLEGRETTIEVLRPDAETVVSLERATPIRIRVEGSFDRTDGPLPYRTMVLAHRAAWDERAEIARVLGGWWAASIRAPRPAPGSELEARHHARMEESALALAREQAPAIGRDLALVDADGVCELRADGTPRGVTVLFPDLRVAYAVVEGDGKNCRARVEPSSFRRLAIRVRRADGRAFADYPVQPASLATLRAGIREIGTRPSTDAEGVVRLGILPGEAIGLSPGLDAWTVSAGIGTTVERLESGYTRAFVVTTRADVAEPSIDVVAEPHGGK